MINAMFVVWRESFEAALVVGILYSYLKKRPEGAAKEQALNFMWLGVLGGVLLSVILALGINYAETELQGIALEQFQNLMLVAACVLITHMCLWMKIHGRKMKSELETGMKEAMDSSKKYEIAILSMLAVAREGSEIVVFLYGVAFEAMEKKMMSSLVVYALIGFVLSIGTWWVFNRGLKFFSQKVFFNVTTVFLLLTASSLILNVTRKLIQSDYLPTIKDVAWDTSGFINEQTSFGQFISGLTGYQSTPALMTVIVFVLYWIMTYGIYKFLIRKECVAKQAVQAA
ncbi:MAG: FTR1 family protein [Rhizobacter sp.]|nr:FTR1 family protein [Bacteriovorax sp.]